MGISRQGADPMGIMKMSHSFILPATLLPHQGGAACSCLGVVKVHGSDANGTLHSLSMYAHENSI